MKKLTTLLLFTSLLIGFSNTTYAQEDYTALNLHVSFGNNNAINAQYEIPVAENITVSPAVVIPFGWDYLAIGVKADYYFDHLMGLSKDWDIWGGLDTGISLADEDTLERENINVFNINAHVGVEYKINPTWGILAEFGGGTAPFGGFGVGIHF